MTACEGSENVTMVKTGPWLREGWAIVRGDLRTFAPAALLAGLLGATVILAGPMLVGMIMMVNKKMRGEQIAVDDVFKGFSKFTPSLVALLVIVAATVLIQCLLGLTGVGAVLVPFVSIFIGGVTFFTFQIIAATDADGIAAIKQSWAKVKPDFGSFCIASLVFDLVLYAGLLVVLLGAMITGPIMVAAMAVAYRDHFGMAGAEPVETKTEAVAGPLVTPNGTADTVN